MQRKNFIATGGTIAAGPAAGARPARRGEPARVQHVQQRAPAAARAQRRPRPRLRRRPRPQPRHGRVLLGRPAAAAHLLRAAGRLRPRRRRWPARRSRWAPPRCWSRAAAPTTTPPATSASTRCGAQAEEAGIPIVLHVGGGGQLLAPEVLRERRRLRPRLPRRRRELPLGRLHGHPRTAGADARHDDLRRRARAAPAPEDRRDRAGRHLDAGLDAPDGVAPSTPSRATSSGCRT